MAIDPTATELTAEEIAALAASPHEAHGDSGGMTARTADEIIKLDQYAQAKASRAAGVNPFAALTMARVITPGT